MTGRRILEIGGIIAGTLMIAFGVGALVMSINARNTVSNEVTAEQIVGSADMNPAAIKVAMKEAGLKNVAAPTCNVADQAIENGSDARCFAQYMRIHALESSGGLTYSQMGRFVAARIRRIRPARATRQPRPRTPTASRSRTPPATPG